MTNISIKLFAMELQISVDRVIQQFLDLGVIKKEEDFITHIEREMLYKYMHRNEISVFNKLTLQRKTRSTLNISSIGGKHKQVQIEVRKKRTYVQCASQDSDSASLKSSDAISKVGIFSVCPSSIVQDKSVVNNNKKVGNSVNSSLSMPISQKNNRYSECSISKYTVEQETNSGVVVKVKQKSEKIPVLLQESYKHIQKHSHIKLTPNVAINNNNTTTRYISSSKDKDNNKKVENERRSRSRMRVRYRFGMSNKLFKHKKNHNYHLYDANIAGISDESDTKEKEELMCVAHRSIKHKRKQSSALIQKFNKPVETIVHNIVIGETITVLELATKMAIKSSHVIKLMMKLGLMVTINQIIDQETAQLVAEEMGHNVILRRENELEESIMSDRVDKKSDILLKNRAPIVTIMGHVDHGKTSLLDYIRSTKIVSSEAGGITQSIGAYHVNTENGMITFLDTPGHAAFTAMRTRGVQLTDIVVLVVAADDGVMPQTIEAIQHVKSAKVSLIVAINKIDKLEANPERIKNELSQYGIVSEEWGGDVQFVNVSAISGQGVDNLLDAILLQSEMLMLKVVHHGMANATVIDSFIDKGRGPVVTVLVREGTLKCGDIVLCGTEYGRIRAMRDEHGCDVISVGPSIPVELLGLSGIPISGELAVVVRDEKKARQVAYYRQGKFREIRLAHQQKLNVENVFVDMKDIDKVSTELNLIVKASTHGFVEAIRDALMCLSKNGDEIVVRVLSASIGAITETDTALAIASSAIILGFNVRADMAARRMIELEGLDVRYYSVIYNLLDEVKQAMKGMLTPKYKHEIIGLAEVRSVFCSPKYGNIAGCIVIEGMIKRFKKIRIIRDNIAIYAGELESLRRFKNDVNEVRSGVECGIGIKNYNEIISGDIIEVFDVVQVSCASSEVKCV